MSYQLEDKPSERHIGAISHYECEIRLLSNSHRVHLTRDGQGRLTKDYTDRMLAVAVAARQQHEVWIRLYQR